MTIAIVGASGAVGQEFLNVLEERHFPVKQLLLFGSQRSAGMSYSFRGEEIQVRELKHGDDFKGVDIALCSAGGSISKEYASTITKHGTVMIDNSSAFRMDDDVPLVVPEVNPEDIRQRPRNIIANPNCTTIQMVVTLKPIENLSHITKVHVSTYQAASGAGATGMTELKEQIVAIAKGEEPKVEKFQHQLAMNIIPHIDVFTPNGYTKEEMKMYHETKKIMHSDVAVSATCVRIPVMRNHSEAIWVETERPLTAEEVRNAMENSPGITVLDKPADLQYPMPLHCTAKDDVFVGRIRQDLCNPCGISYWCVGDQIKKGAALNAIQIAELLLAK